MSINSKARREAKKRNVAKAGAGKPAGPPIEPHAELRDQQGRLLAGIVRRDGEWVLGMDGKIAGTSESAAHMLAMIKRAARLHEAHGTPVRLKYSDALKDAAYGEVQAADQTFDEFEALLASTLGAYKP
ncbi:hypothetical protein [Pseudoxanthomonas sacheonensis]|uniref:hypothetical protein n=1 Tax=Pseudoxanthomonas sacheonensis TaxID=443615 RepID=UPI0013D43253|nr:hypothetical protein [Pseudoxanthomonas sacheonensis]KAF1706956.1 hypothetical protein CSC73_14155 [Pseudoxanthomonas sacheonensis]